MHRTRLSALGVTAFALTLAVGPLHAQDESRAVSGGGVLVPGWTGRIDTGEEEDGQTLDDARLAMEDDVLQVTTGPAASYWNPENTASGNYTVQATFTESNFMSLNDHPHPYGIFIAGNDMDTDEPSFLYCSAYGNGSFIVRGFGPEPFQLNGRRAEENAAINQAAGPGEPVTQEIALSVTDDAIECAINGTVVGSYDKASVVAPDMLTSTDGVYGIRFGHNTEATVADLTLVDG